MPFRSDRRFFKLPFFGALMSVFTHSKKKYLLAATFTALALSSGATFSAPASQSDHTWPQSFSRAQDDQQRATTGGLSGFMVWMRVLFGA
jgi:hypothetical protein